MLWDVVFPVLAGCAALAVFVYTIIAIVRSESSDESGLLFSSRCALVINGLGYGYPAGRIALYERHLALSDITGKRYSVEYGRIRGIGTRFTADSLFGLPWWKTLQIQHDNPNLPKDISVVVSRSSARAILEMMQKRVGSHRGVIPGDSRCDP